MRKLLPAGWWFRILRINFAMQLTWEVHPFWVTYRNVIFWTKNPRLFLRTRRQLAALRAGKMLREV